MEVHGEDICAAGDAVAPVIGHDGKERWEWWGKVVENFGVVANCALLV